MKDKILWFKFNLLEFDFVIEEYYKAIGIGICGIEINQNVRFLFLIHISDQFILHLLFVGIAYHWHAIKNKLRIW